MAVSLFTRSRPFIWGRRTSVKSSKASRGGKGADRGHLEGLPGGKGADRGHLEGLPRSQGS
jgi:hypothetical protein